MRCRGLISFTLIYFILFICLCGVIPCGWVYEYYIECKAKKEFNERQKRYKKMI